MLKYLAIGLIAVLIISAGYLFLYDFKFSKVDPKQLLLSYGNKFNNVDKIKLSYLLNIPTPSDFLLEASEIPIEYYKLNDKMKVVDNMTGTTTEYYSINDYIVGCKVGSLMGSKSSLRCKVQIQQPFSPKLDESMINQTEILYEGVKKIEGRNCDDFVLLLNRTQIDKLSTPIPRFKEQTSLLSQIIYEICIDKEYGYPAWLNISFEQFSEKTTLINLFSMKVTKISTNIGAEDLVLPSFVLDNVSCNRTSVSFDLIAFKDITNPRIDVSLYGRPSPNITSNKIIDSIVTGKTYHIEIPITAKYEGYFVYVFDVSVCIGGDCQESWVEENKCFFNIL